MSHSPHDSRLKSHRRRKANHRRRRVSEGRAPVGSMDPRYVGGASGRIGHSETPKLDLLEAAAAIEREFSDGSVLDEREDDHAEARAEERRREVEG